MSDRVIGRIVVHPRGFGFVDLEHVEGGGRLDDRLEGASAFVPPREMNAFLEGDLVSALVVESQPGRFSAQEVTLVERSRRELFGPVVTHGARTFVRVDREVANTDWVIASEGGAPPAD